MDGFSYSVHYLKHFSSHVTFFTTLKNFECYVIPFRYLSPLERRIHKIFTASVWRKICLPCHKEHKKILLKKHFSSKFLTWISQLLEFWENPESHVLTLRWRLPLAIRLWKLSTLSGWSKTCLHCNRDQKKIWWKKVFHRNFWLKFHIFQRPLKQSQTIELSFTCLLLIEIQLWKPFTVFRWCKTCAHWIKEHKKILLKKSFHRNFWLKFDISHGAITRKVLYVPTLSVKKKFETLNQKSASTVLSGLIWRTD